MTSSCSFLLWIVLQKKIDVTRTVYVMLVIQIFDYWFIIDFLLEIETE